MPPKLKEDGENDRLRYGLSSMQGWRTTMEDAVSRLCILIISIGYVYIHLHLCILVKVVPHIYALCILLFK